MARRSASAFSTEKLRGLQIETWNSEILRKVVRFAFHVFCELHVHISPESVCLCFGKNSGRNLFQSGRFKHTHTHTHSHFMSLSPGPPWWAGARRELLDFRVQVKINRGRHTDHPVGRHSIQTNQCLPPPSPHFLQAGCPSCRLTNSVKALKEPLMAVIYQPWIDYKYCGGTA